MAVVLGIDPKISKSDLLSSSGEIIRHFQNHGFLKKLSLVSVISPALYPVPYSWFEKMKRDYQKEVQRNLDVVCKQHFDFEEVKVLISQNSTNEEVVRHFIRYVQRSKADLMVLFGQNNRKVQHWLLGSFLEVAALRAANPLLVLKPQVNVSDLSQSVRVVVAIDTEVKISSKAMAWIVNFLKTSKAEVLLVYVRPRPIFLVPQEDITFSNDADIKKMQGYQAMLERKGLSASIHILEEETSIAQTIVDFSEENKSWMIVTFSVSRSTVRKILLGSSARKVLSISKRPFLNVHVED